MKKFVLYALMGLSLVTTSCSDDFLGVDYYDVVSPEGVYSTKDNVFKGLMGVYNTLYYGVFGLSPHPQLANLPALDIQAEGWDAEMTTHSWGVESKSGFFENGWKGSYNQINRVNLFLKDLENVDESVMSAAEKKIYEAECRAIRGAAYYFLTINFSRVPMLMTGETYQTSPDKARPESDDEAWQIIKEDFEFAAEVLDWEPAEGQIGRFTKGGALAYAAKVNMYLGDFAKAKQQYKQIIDSGTAKLNPCFAMCSWPDNPNSYETLWEVSFPEFASMGWDVWSFSMGSQDVRFFGQQTWAREYGGWGGCFVSYEFVRSFEPGDKRLQYTIAGWDAKRNLDDIDPQTGNPRGDTNPYTGQQVGMSADYQMYYIVTQSNMPNNNGMKWWKNTTTYGSYSVNLYRYGGALLDYAECCFRTNDEATGWATLAEIRNRAWGNLEVGHDPNATTNSIYKFPNEVLNTAVVPVPDAEEFYTKYKAEKGYSLPVWQVAVIQERRKELIQEFDLWYALSRCSRVDGVDVTKEWLDCEYPKNGGATFYNTQTGEYYVPSSSVNRNEPWNNASAAEREHMIPVFPRDWDWNPNRLVYPIPTSELTANQLMTQNPGYE